MTLHFTCDVRQIDPHLHNIISKAFIYTRFLSYARCEAEMVDENLVDGWKYMKKISLKRLLYLVFITEKRAAIYGSSVDAMKYWEEIMKQETR